jgi:Sulfatase
MVDQLPRDPSHDLPGAVPVQRAMLPIPDTAYRGTVVYDAKSPDASFPPIVPTEPPDAAPNVLVVLIDDTGFGASSVFGGPVNMPVAERLAGSGLRYTRFHTTRCARRPGKRS